MLQSLTKKTKNRQRKQQSFTPTKEFIFHFKRPFIGAHTHTSRSGQARSPRFGVAHKDFWDEIALLFLRFFSGPLLLQQRMALFQTLYCRRKGRAGRPRTRDLIVNGQQAFPVFDALRESRWRGAGGWILFEERCRTDKLEYHQFLCKIFEIMRTAIVTKKPRWGMEGISL
jgi:hypothetical protein